MQRSATRAGAWMALWMMLLLPAVVSAQQASVSGRVTDEQGASLPGVTVTATATVTGRQITAVAGGDGAYRLVGLQPGRYSIAATLSGFATRQMNDIELLVGQNATLDFPMALATLSETVTVSSVAPLVDSQQARVAGNVDSRQMENLPISGRNWQQLSTMVKGITANTVGNQPGVNRDASFQLNLDGQQITQNVCCSGGFGQPGISRDAIAEFQVITNLFDVTMGRSVGIQVQAVSKAGTNNPSGSLYGFFRDDAFNAKDAFANRVLPYSNSQMGGTIGGPIIRDKMHYFGSYEYEREPNTTVLTPSALPGQSFSIPTMRFVHNTLGRVDYQMNAENRFTVRSSRWLHDRPTEIAGHPSRINRRLADSSFTSVGWSHVGSQQSLHELKVNYFMWHHLFEPKPGSPLVPEYIFPGITLGPNWNYPEEWWERFVTTRYDYTVTAGRHDLKIGAEVRLGGNTGWWLARSRGQMRFSSLPSNASTRFPASAATDPSQWDFTGLDATALRYEIYYARYGGGIDDMGDWSFDIPRPAIAGWIGDTWRMNRRLTLNMGVRYDVGWEDVSPPGLEETDVIIDTGRGYVENVGYRNNIRDLNNVAPRGGFAWNVTGNNDLVIRGGAGLYFSTAAANQPIDQALWNGQRVIAASFVNDGQPGWILDPTRGITADDVLEGRVPLPPQSISVIAHDFQMPVAMQSMLGFQKQLTDVIGFDADLVYNRGWHEDSQRDPNLFYDPATGLPRNPSVFGRPNPAYGPINLKESKGESENLQLATSFTRRYRNNFQVGVTYTYMFYKKDTGVGNAGYGATQMNTFDIMMDWADASDFQRHTFRVNGIWSMPFGLTAAGSFRYGSGNPTTINGGSDPLGLGTNRIRRDLSIIGRNSFMGDPFQTLDLRLSKDFRIANAFTLTGIAEVFNIYNYERYSYNVLETSANFGRANGSAGDPRTGQLAFRVSW
jgi:hypothetical protein